MTVACLFSKIRGHTSPAPFKCWHFLRATIVVVIVSVQRLLHPLLVPFVPAATTQIDPCVRLPLLSLLLSSSRGIHATTDDAFFVQKKTAKTQFRLYFASRERRLHLEGSDWIGGTTMMLRDRYNRRTELAHLRPFEAANNNS